MSAIADIYEIYRGSDGERTKALYAKLEAFGAAGNVAINLFRAQKASERAKAYRGGNSRGSYRGQAYDKKQWSLDNLTEALSRHAEELGLRWGWGVDDKQPVHRHVLYLDLPTGQVSFHSGQRGGGRDYAGEWDGMAGQSPDRIIRWIARLLDEKSGVAA